MEQVIEKRGRKSKLSSKLTEELRQAISEGLHDSSACAICGIDPSTFYRWLRKGEEGESKEFSQFYQTIKKANAERERSWIRFISKDESWQSKAWLLERRFPQKWGRNQKADESQDRSLQVVFHGLNTLSADEWERLTQDS